MFKKFLVFTVKMTAIDLPVIINRGLTQPKSLDILDATYDMLPILWPSGKFQPKFGVTSICDLVPGRAM